MVVNYSSDIDFQDNMNLKSTAEPYSFLVIDTTLPSGSWARGFNSWLDLGGVMTPLITPILVFVNVFACVFVRLFVCCF